jgi:pimeloyl-ACP methyl ester carboxylesterase
MALAQINGIEIYFEEQGNRDGEPVLLIMGLGGNALAWAPQIEALVPHYRVIAFDNRGAGRTSKPEGPYTMTQMAADAAGVLDEVSVPSAHIVGASMGGMIAQEFALQYPQRVRTLTLMCTTPGGPHSAGFAEMKVAATELDRTEDLAAAMTPERMQEMMLQMFSPEFIANPGPGFAQMVGSAVQFPATAESMRSQMAAILAHDTYGRLPTIVAPTLVMAGDADPMVDPANAHILAERIPGAQLRMYPGLRHGFTAERPDEVNAALLDFLGKHATAKV